ncbi:MAG: glycosyltransferase family 2 protein, partial [Candidatus Nanopelagicaceae bacterium]
MTPLFSIITPVYEPPRRGFEECIESVFGQVCGEWEWCLVEDRSPREWVRDRLRALEAEDARIQVAYRESNGGIVAATNDALALATGTFIALLDNDDELEPDALEVMAELIASEPDLDYAYSDELVWSVGINRYVRLWKPGWSPERMRSQNYANHLSVFRKSLVHEVGGYRAGFDGAQDHDLVLRVGEQARVIRHVPRSLYRWKVAPGSTVSSPEAKTYAFDAGVRAVQEHCDRVGIDAIVGHGPSPGVYRVRRRVQGDPLVSVIIPSNAPVATVGGEERSLLEGVVRDLVERTDYANIEVLVVPDPQTDRERLDAARLLDPDRVRVTEPIPRPFNFSRKSNFGAASSRGEFLLFLNDDIAMHDPVWLNVLLA